MKDQSKIHFSDLSAWLKTSVVISFILGSIYGIYILVGMISGILGA